MDELMTLREWDASGVARLRPDERAALEIWLQRYRTLLLDSASSSAHTALRTESSGEVAAPAPNSTTASSAPVNMAPLAPSQSSGTSAAGSAPAANAFAPPSTGAAPPTAAAPAGSQYPAPSNTVATPGNTGNPPSAQQPAYAPPAASQPVYNAPAPPSSPPAAPVVPYPTAPTTSAQQPAPPSYPGAAYSGGSASSGAVAPIGAVVRTGLSVRSVLVGNRFVTLTDGSMWDVYPADRPEAGVWHSSDPVYVRVATSNVNGGYDRELVNAARNVLVRARFAGEVSLSGNDGR